MKHFLNLERCTCGAYRYLAVREHKRSYEVYLIHHSHSQTANDSRKYRKLASIPKYRLNMHDVRLNETEEEKRISLTFEQQTVLKELLKELVAKPEGTEPPFEHSPETTALEIEEPVPV